MMGLFSNPFLNELPEEEIVFEDMPELVSSEPDIYSANIDVDGDNVPDAIVPSRYLSSNKTNRLDRLRQRFDEVQRFRDERSRRLTDRQRKSRDDNLRELRGIGPTSTSMNVEPVTSSIPMNVDVDNDGKNDIVFPTSWFLEGCFNGSATGTSEAGTTHELTTVTLSDLLKVNPHDSSSSTTAATTSESSTLESDGSCASECAHFARHMMKKGCSCS